MASNDMFSSWQPPAAPSDGQSMVSALDPRVIRSHSVGVLPCPKNPPAPAGWQYWRGDLPVGGGEFAEEVLHDSTSYPMGTFVQKLLHGHLVGARVEWHDVKGKTGERGCFRGVNLMKPVTAAVSTSSTAAPRE
ncbi:MAG TPA: hypothetical protein VIV60_02505 [Polyangiaceae bacterium]